MTEQTNALNEAIAGVMGQVKRLEKGDSNKFADYKYTSVDDFKDAIRPLLAAQGIVVHTTEIGAVETTELTNTKGQKSLVARYVFSFTLAHKSGEKGEPEQSTVMLPYTGAQTTGAARSYALKEWLKSKFLMSSGELVDADADQQHEYSGKGGNGFPAGNPEVKYPKYPADAKPTPGVVRARDNNKYFAEKLADLRAIGNLRDLRDWWAMHDRDLQEMVSPTGYQLLESEFADRENEFAARVPVK